MESTDELREYGHDCCARVDDAIHDYCDEIEREIAERYMLLPVDADGVPIRLGDVMDGVGMYDTLRDVTGEVIEVSFNATDSNEFVASVALQVWSEDGKSWRRVYIDQYADRYRHVKPRTIEDVLHDVWKEALDYTKSDMWRNPDEVFAERAAEIRELLGVSE